MKRVFVLICCAAVLISMFVFSGCSGIKNAEAAFEVFMNAHENGDMSEIIDLVPPSYYNYYKEKSIKDGYDKETAERIAEMNFRPTFFNVDFVNMLGYDFSMKDELSFDYKIADTYHASGSEVKEFNKFVKDKFDFNIGADDIVLIKAVYSVDSENDLIDRADMAERGICIETNGKWYYLSCSARRTADLFTTRKGLQMEDYVEWMYNWLNDL